MSAAARVQARRWMLAGILLLAFALRMYRLGTDSLWYDETVSVHLASKSIPALVAHTAGDIHPPGYYVMLHLWLRLAGAASAGARDVAAAFPSLFFGVLLAALAHRLASLAYGNRAGMLAALLVAVSPYNLWYSQEVRMYTVGATLAVGTILSIIPAVRAGVGRLPSWRALAAYALCAALGLWMLYYFAFLLVALNLVVAVWWLAGWLPRRLDAGAGRAGALQLGRQSGRLAGGPLAWAGRWLLAQSAVLLLYAAWIPVAWRQATSPPVPPWRPFTALGTVVIEVWSALSLGQSADPARVWPALVLLGLLFAIGLVANPGQRRKRPGPPLAPGPADAATSSGARCVGWHPLSWFLAACTFLPLALIFLASYITPLYHIRYAFTYSAPFCAVLAGGLSAVGRRWKLGLWLALAAILAFSGLSIFAYHTDSTYATDDHRAAVAFLSDRWRPGDAILVDAGYVYTALGVYWESDPIAWRGRLVGDAPPSGVRGPAIYLAGSVDGDPGLGWGDPDSDFYAMTQAESEVALAQLFAAHDRVWLYRCYDTVTDPQGTIRQWLAGHGTPFEDQVFAGEAYVRVQGFLTGRKSPLIPDGPSDWPFGTWLALDANHVESFQVPVGGTVDQELLWRVQYPPTSKDPVLFAGLYSEYGFPWGSVDERPPGSLFQPADWPVGAYVGTPLRIRVPAGTPVGTYWVHAGWYELVDGQKEWITPCPCRLMIVAEIEVVAPQDWASLPIPEFDYSLGVTVGNGVRLLGMDGPDLEGVPGSLVFLTLFWQAQVDAPAPGPVVLQLTAADGSVVAEQSHVPAYYTAPFNQMEASQVVRDPADMRLPNHLDPGTYELWLGRQAPDGTWLPVRRGFIPLGHLLPLTTIRVLEREVDETPPSVEHPVDARFGDAIRLAGFHINPPASEWRAGQSGEQLVFLTVYWQALADMDTRYKIFLHLIGDGGPSDIRAQSDIYPELPTTAWIAGEYLRDSLTLDLPAAVPAGKYALLLGLYDEETGLRLPVYDRDGNAAGDSLTLLEVDLEP